MKIKLLILPLAAMLIISTAQVMGAQPDCDFGPGPGCGDGPGFGFGHRMGILKWAEELELTPEQVKKIETVRLEMAKATIELRNQLELKQLELRELISADQPDRKRIEAKIDEIAPLRTALLKKHIEHRLAMKDVLTSEQRAKLETMHGSGMQHQRGRQRDWRDDREDRDREPGRR